MLFTYTPLRRRCLTILIDALHCISNGLAGSQRAPIGYRVGFDRYMYIFISAGFKDATINVNPDLYFLINNFKEKDRKRFIFICIKSAI